MLFVQIQYATNFVWEIDAEEEIIYNCTITKATQQRVFCFCILGHKDVKVGHRWLRNDRRFPLSSTFRWTLSVPANLIDSITIKSTGDRS